MTENYAGTVHPTLREQEDTYNQRTLIRGKNMVIGLSVAMVAITFGATNDIVNFFMEITDFSYFSYFEKVFLYEVLGLSLFVLCVIFMSKGHKWARTGVLICFILIFASSMAYYIWAYAEMDYYQIKIGLSIVTSFVLFFVFLLNSSIKAYFNYKADLLDGKSVDIHPIESLGEHKHSGREVFVILSIVSFVIQVKNTFRMLYTLHIYSDEPSLQIAIVLANLGPILLQIVFLVLIFRGVGWPKYAFLIFPIIGYPELLDYLINYGFRVSFYETHVVTMILANISLWVLFFIMVLNTPLNRYLEEKGLSRRKKDTQEMM